MIVHKEAVKIIIAEPIACTKKYFNAASEENWLFFEEIRGIKDKRFSSSPTQAVNQEGEEIVKIVPKIKVVLNKIWAEEKKIKKRRG